MSTASNSPTSQLRETEGDPGSLPVLRDYRHYSITERGSITEDEMLTRGQIKSLRNRIGERDIFVSTGVLLRFLSAYEDLQKVRRMMQKERPSEALYKAIAEVLGVKLKEEDC